MTITDCFVRDPFTYRLLRQAMPAEVPPLYVVMHPGPGDKRFQARCYRRGNLLGLPFYGRCVFELGVWLFDPILSGFLHVEGLPGLSSPPPNPPTGMFGPTVVGTPLRSPTLGWRATFYYEERDREMMKDAVKAGDAVVGFFAWLFDQHEAAHACPYCGFGTEIRRRITNNDWYVLPCCDVCQRCGRSFNHRGQ